MRLFGSMCVALLFGATLGAEKRQDVGENDVYVDDQGSLVRSTSYSDDNGRQEGEEPQQYAVEYEPPNYNYAYAVQDDYVGNFQQAREARDGDRTRGSYRVLQPDGVTRTVVYRVDGDQGFNADVTFTPNHGHQQQQQYQHQQEARSARSLAAEDQQQQGPVEYVRVVDQGEYEAFQRQQRELEDQSGGKVVRYYRALPDDPRTMDFLPAFAPVPETDVQYFTINDAVKNQEQEAVRPLLFTDDYNEAADDLNDPPADPVEEVFEQQGADAEVNQDADKANNGIRTRKVTNVRVQESNGPEDPELKFKILVGAEQEQRKEKKNKDAGSPLAVKSVVPLPPQLVNFYRSRYPVVDFSNPKFGPGFAGPIAAAIQAEKKRQQKKREDKEQGVLASSPKHKRQLSQQAFPRANNQQQQQFANNFPSFGQQQLPSFPAAGQHFPGLPQFSQAQLRQIAQQQQQQGRGNNGQQLPGLFSSPFSFPGGPGAFPGFDVRPSFGKQSNKVKSASSSSKDDKKKTEEDKNSILQNLGLDEDDYEVQAVDSIKEALKALKEQGGDGAVVTLAAKDEPRNPEELLNNFRQQQQNQKPSRKPQQQQQQRRPHQQQFNPAFAALQAINAQSQRPLQQPGFPVFQQVSAGAEQSNRQPGQFLPSFGIQQGQEFRPQQSGQFQQQQQRPQELLQPQDDPDFFGQGQPSFLPPQANLRNPNGFPAQLAANAFRPEVNQPSQFQVQGFSGVPAGFSPSPVSPVRNRRPGATQGNNRPFGGRPSSDSNENRPGRNTNRPRPNRPIRNAQSEGGLFSNFPSLNFGGGLRGLFNRQPAEGQSNSGRAQRSVRNEQSQAAAAEGERPGLFQGQRPRFVRHLFRNRHRDEAEKPAEESQAPAVESTDNASPVVQS